MDCETCGDTGTVLIEAEGGGMEPCPCWDCVTWGLTDEVPAEKTTEGEPCHL